MALTDEHYWEDEMREEGRNAEQAEGDTEVYSEVQCVECGDYLTKSEYDRLDPDRDTMICETCDIALYGDLG